jgi:DNA-binding protein HU-beta
MQTPNIKEIKMNKAELISKISDDNGFSKGEAEKALNSVIEGVEDALKNGDSVTLVGFGTFSVSDRAARIGRNPQTGASIQIPAKKVVKFKAGKTLSEAV